MVLALIGPHPENVTAHFHPYVSEFHYVPEYHPSRNPNCISRWPQQKFCDEQLEHKNHRHSSIEEPLVDQAHPWIEIRAILVHCSKTHKKIGKVSSQRQRNCRRKVIISMKINNVGKTNTREEFILVDHVLDPVKMRKIRLHNPYVIKIRQESLLHLYGLRFQSIVNAEAREEVINNRRANFTGCNDGLENPTCGQMLINEEMIPFSQGFCCSCEDAQHTRSFHSIAAKSNYHRRNGNANRARNRSESSANLFDNPKAQRQLEASENEEHDRGDARERVTSHNISTVNGLLGERVPPLWNRREEKWNNSTGLSKDVSRNVNRASPASKNIFFDPMPNKRRIEAYINDVYEQSMKEKAVKEEDNNRSNDLLDGNLGDWKSELRESSSQIADRWFSNGQFPIRGSVTDNPRNSTEKLATTKDNYDSGKFKFRETSLQFFDHHRRDDDGQSSLPGSVANAPRNPTTELTKLEGKQDFTKTDSEKDNRKFLQLEKCDRPVNVLESGNRGQRARDRSRGVVRLENTFDYTPPFSTIHPSRIPEGSQFSRRTKQNVFSNAPPDNASFVIRSFASSEIPLQIKNSDTNYKSINYGVASSTMKSNDFEKDVIALLSKILISETNSSTTSERRRYEFGVLENIANNVSASRNAPLERKNSSAVAIRDDNASSARGKAGNANVSRRISVVPAFTRLRNLSSSVGIPRLEELSVPVAAAALPADKSSTRIQDSRTRGWLLANGMRGSSDNEYKNLYDDRKTRKVYNSPERASKYANLKNGYKFRKRDQKLRKDAGKFRGDKSDVKRFGRSSSSRESTRKRDGFSDEFSLREQRLQKRLRRHLQARNRNFNSTYVRKAKLRNEDSHRETQVLQDCDDRRSDAAYSKRKMSEIRARSPSGSPRKQVILQSGHSYGKVQFEKNDNPFLFNNEDGKESNVDKRIEDKFARISDVLKEDSAKKLEIIQETPKNSGAVATSVVASADISKIPNELKDDLFSRKNDKSDEVTNQDDQVTRECLAKSIDTFQRVTAKFTLTNSEVASAFTRKDDSFDYKESAAAAKPEVKLSATVLGPFLSSPLMRTPEYNASKKINFDESTSSIYANDLATMRARFVTRKLPPATPRGGNVDDYFEDVSGPPRISPSGWTSSKEAATSPGALNNRKSGERDGAENARFLGLNNDSSRMIAGNFAGPRGSPVRLEPSLRGSDSVIKPEEAAPSGYKDLLLENSNSVPANSEVSGRSHKSREKDEIAELVDRIVRQYAAYTPVMPGMPTFDEITEAETLPPDEETTVAQLATTLATTTRITDVAFRPSIRPLQTTLFPEEMHDEVPLDESTFADETEATKTSRKMTITKRKFQHGKSLKKINVSSKTSESGEERQKITNSVIKMTEEEAEDHPWHRTTETQQIISAHKSKPIHKTEKGKKARDESKIDYFRNASSGWTSPIMMITSGAVDDIVQARSKRLDLNHDFSIFNDYEAKDEEDRQSGRAVLNKNGESADAAEPTELRSKIEKRLTGLDYPANRKSFRHNCENRNQSQRNNVALQNIVARNIELHAANDLFADVQKKKRNTQGNLRNLTSPKTCHVRDDIVSKFEENILLRNRKATSATCDTLSPDLAKIPASREDLSGLVRERLEIDRRTRTRKRVFAKRAMVDGIVMMRKVAVNLSENARTANADDLSDRVAESRQKSRMKTGRVLPVWAKNPGNRDKSRETDAIVRGAKLMITDDDRSETRDLNVTAKSVDKKIPPPPPPFSVAKQRKREDASKINENPVDPRVRRVVHIGEKYLPRPRGKIHDTVREMIRKIKKRKSSSNKAGIAETIARDEVRADRSAPANRHRSGRRLLSDGKSSNIADVDDEYYEDDESEMDAENDSASDNEAIARRDDLSDLEYRAGLRGDRDPRKLTAETDRSASGYVDAARTVMPEKRTVAAWDAPIISDNVQTIGEQAISRNNKKETANINKNFKDKHNIDAVLEFSDPADFNIDKILKAPIENEEKSDIKNIVNNNSFAQKKTLDVSENSLRSSQTYEEIDEEPLSLNEKINKDNSQDESLYETQPTLAFNMTESSFTTINRNLSDVEKAFRNVDFSQSSMTPKSEGNIKISLIGRIQVSGGFNQTPMLISFDAIPDRSAASSVSADSSNTVVTVESTAINLPSDDSRVEATFDLSSITERVNDEADDSLSTMSGDDREVEKVNEVAIRSREKFFDLARGSEKERKRKKENSSRIEKRLDKYNGNSDKQVILMDCLKPAIAPDSKIDRTSSVGETISARADEATDKLDPRSPVSPVRFPEILGSVLINNNTLKNRDAIKESQSRTDTPSIETYRFDSKSTILHIVPLTRVENEGLNFNFAKDESNKTICCPGEDSGNATSGGCYRIPTIVRKLELPGTTSRELLQTWSNYRGSDPVETFPSGIRKAVANDRNAGITRSSSSMQSRDDVSETAMEYTTSKTLLLAKTSCGKFNNESTNAIRVRNMMAIVRFMMKLLRIISENEEPPCAGTRVGQTVIHVKDTIVNASSHGRSDVEKQQSVTDTTTSVASEKTRQNLMIAGWRPTERIRAKSLSKDENTFESFTEAPSRPTAFVLPTSSDEVLKDIRSSTLFETSTGREVHALALSSATSSATPKFFLFYERNSPPSGSRVKDASRENTNADSTGVKQNSNVAFNESKAGGKESRLDDGQASRSWPQNRDRSTADRLRLGKQEIASSFKSNRIASAFFRPKYLGRNKNGGFWWSQSIADSTIGPMLSHDTDVPPGSLLGRIATRRDKSGRSTRSGKARRARVSDRHATRTKLLNSSARGGPPVDWIGEHRATARLSVDKKRPEIPGRTMATEKVRRVRGEINRSRDPNRGNRGSDSFKVEERGVIGSRPAAELSTDDALSINGGLSSLQRAKKTNANRYQTSSGSNNNPSVSEVGEEIRKGYISALEGERDISEHRDFQKSNRVFKKRQEVPSPAKRKKKTKWQKKKRKKGGQRKNVAQTGNQRFKRHLLMAPLELEALYDVDDVATRLPRRYIAEERDADDFRKSARANARRRKDGGSRTIDRSEADLGRAQIRGGQDCTDRRHPPNTDAKKYLESAHCLRFSNLWYSVYQLEDPIIEHTVYLQIYEKRALANGSSYWEDLTGNSVVRLGTFNRHYRDSEDTIAFAYKEVKTPGREEKVPNLDVVRDRLLVPSSVTSKGSGYSIEDKSNEYLIVPASDINENGNECDKAGVGFAAFAEQPDRCERVRGTCLKNQPLAYRRHDAEARAAGRPGCYFLSNFASVPSEPIKYSANGSGSREFLALKYHSPHVSAIDIEVKADYNAALAGGPLGRISEVRVDSTALDHTVVTVVITNTRLISSSYRSKITDCPDDLPESWVNATFPRKIVQSRRDQTVSLDLYGELPVNEFYCSVQLLNHLGEPVATRRIKIRKMDHCSCTLQCSCVCVGDTRGTGCRPLSPELYHAAGFRGPVPTVTRHIFSDTTVDVLLFIVSLILLLLFTGFLKWLIGLYIPAVSRWGLDSFVETSRMSQYFERELKCKCVVTDERGAPVHPDTRKRTVRICSRKAEFFSNAMFFLIFPPAVCYYRLKKCFQPARRRCPNESKVSLTSENSERPRTICVSTYGDSRDSQMEAEDTKYVMDELKKSELLRSHSSHSRCKRNCRTKEYRSHH